MKRATIAFLILLALALCLAATTKINLTTQVVGVLPIANGGTNAAAGINSGILYGFCTGTVGTGNGTTYFLGQSNISTMACNQTTLLNSPMPWGCSAQKLYVKAGAAGGAAGSGVIKVYRNGSASTITCTLGTGTTCNDTTHTVAYSTGDTFGLAVTTGQASDTTANIRATFQCL